MPCLRDYIIQDPFGIVIERGVDVVPPQEITKVAKQDLRELDFPSYRDDPSYFWAKRYRR